MPAATCSLSRNMEQTISTMNDGMAHRTWIDSENSDVLRMDAFGIFTRAPEGAEEESFDF